MVAFKFSWNAVEKEINNDVGASNVDDDDS